MWEGEVLKAFLLRHFLRSHPETVRNFVFEPQLQPFHITAYNMEDDSGRSTSLGVVFFLLLVVW